ncbi:P1 family peptidase [Nonomuraea sp. NPDC050536]|uniref:P1 family peptidase n=1 Tax=Nonomuraea sp. NPDC050536 TaxID=3364366 RepID=UPI0037CAFCB3
MYRQPRARLHVPCSALQLSRIAARGVLGLGQVGAAFSHGSGDYGLAFSAEPSKAPRTLTPAELDGVFAAVMESVEEAPGRPYTGTDGTGVGFGGDRSAIAQAWVVSRGFFYGATSSS